jgi:tetratricopeptide (TPR) repeat protein
MLMDFMNNVFLSPKRKKDAQYSKEYKKFQTAVQRNPQDHGLRAQFVKFCLVSHFTLEGIPQAHLKEALAHYEEVIRADLFDPQIYYLVGRYYLDKDSLKAQTVYLAGVQHFNQFVEKSPGLKSDYVEMAYAIALNFVTLQYGQIHPDLEKFFKIIRKSYPLHNKRVELENALRNPDANQGRIKQLTHELRELKEAIEAARPNRASKN